MGPRKHFKAPSLSERGARGKPCERRVLTTFGFNPWWASVGDHHASGLRTGERGMHMRTTPIALITLVGGLALAAAAAAQTPDPSSSAASSPPAASSAEPGSSADPGADRAKDHADPGSAATSDTSTTGARTSPGSDASATAPAKDDPATTDTKSKKKKKSWSNEPASASQPH